MQTTDRYASPTIDPINRPRAGSGNLHRSRTQKAHNRSSGGGYDFLTATYAPVIPHAAFPFGTASESVLCGTRANYDYLLESARRYAQLQGCELRHDPGTHVREGIRNLYGELSQAIGDWQLNLEIADGRLCFVVWRDVPHDVGSVYWLPIRFVEKLSGPLRRMTIDLLHKVVCCNDLCTICQSNEFAILRDTLEQDEMGSGWDTDGRLLKNMVTSYEEGRVHRRFQRILTGPPYYKNLARAINRYTAGNELESRLIGLLCDGLEFTAGQSSFIRMCGYIPYDTTQIYEHPIYLEQIFMLTYANDEVCEQVLTWMNEDLNCGSPSLGPVFSYMLRPDMTEPVAMNPYPERFIRWFSALIELSYDMI